MTVPAEGPGDNVIEAALRQLNLLKRENSPYPHAFSLDGGIVAIARPADDSEQEMRNICTPFRVPVTVIDALSLQYRYDKPNFDALKAEQIISATVDLRIRLNDQLFGLVTADFWVVLDPPKSAHTVCLGFIGVDSQADGRVATLACAIVQDLAKRQDTGFVAPLKLVVRGKVISICPSDKPEEILELMPAA